MTNNYECVVCIVNHGYSDLVMTSAHRAGATGGTVFSGRGTGNREVTEFFGVTVTPEKDVVLIIVPKAIRDAVLSAINEGAGMATKGMGIAFALPVSDVVGLQNPDKPATEKPAEETK